MKGFGVDALVHSSYLKYRYMLWPLAHYFSLIVNMFANLSVPTSSMAID